MAWSLPVLTAVLLGLSAQPAGASSADFSPAAITCVHSAGDAKSATSPGLSEPACISVETLARTSDYLRQCAAGRSPNASSAAAWGQFFPACDGLVRQYAGHFKSRGVDVDDCTQETWSQLLRTLPNFQLEQGRGQFISWLYTVVRNKANDQLRRSARAACEDLSLEIQESAASREPGPAEAMERASAIEQVRRALDLLRDQVSEVSYRVLHLRHIERLSVSDVASTLGLTPQQVWARDHRMRCKLRDLLSERFLSEREGIEPSSAREAGGRRF